MSGGREQKGREGRGFSTWQSREVGQVNFLFGPLTLLYLFPSLVQVPLKTLILTSYCLLSSTRAALFYHFLFFFFGWSSSLLMHPEVLFSPVPAPTVPHEGRQKTQEKWIASYLNSNTQPCTCSSVQETNSRLSSHYLCLFWKVAFPTAFFSSCWSPCVGPEERGGEGWSRERPVSGCWLKC